MTKIKSVWYRLEGKEPVRVHNILQLLAGSQDKTVGDDHIDGLHVSTMCLGVDYSYTGGTPLLFATMVYADLDGPALAFKRYATWEEAETGHAAMCGRVRAGEVTA